MNGNILSSQSLLKPQGVAVPTQPAALNATIDDLRQAISTLEAATAELTSRLSCVLSPIEEPTVSGLSAKEAAVPHTRLSQDVSELRWRVSDQITAITQLLSRLEI